MLQHDTALHVSAREEKESASVQHRNAPPFTAIDRKEMDKLTLNRPGAHTVERNRWERLSVVHDIPASLDEVWHALTDPEALGQWFGMCYGGHLGQVDSDCILDFEDGEYFLCRTVESRAPYFLQYRWRWMGIGPVWTVTWQMEMTDETHVHVLMTEDAFNPPSRWQHWNGEGWPGILDQLAFYVRMKTYCRWPWRREGYALTELDYPVYEAWDRLFSPSGLKYWLLPLGNAIVAPNQTLQIHIGDASGTVEMQIHDVVPPSFRSYPSLTFSMKRAAWHAETPGRIFMEPAGWGRSVLQMFQQGWENLPAELQRSERLLVAGYWRNAMDQAAQVCQR